MNTQQNNSKLTQLPVVMFWQVSAVSYGEVLHQLLKQDISYSRSSPQMLCPLFIAGMRFVLAGFLVILFHSIQERHWIMPEPGLEKLLYPFV